MSGIDFSYLDEISGGDMEFRIEMIQTFLDETPKDVAHMDAMAQAANWAEVGKVAHKMKSSIKMFGLESIKNQAVEIEQIGKSGAGTETLGQKVATFILGLQQAMVHLKGHL
jgi:HPt (histidine-containing phosphotransfer) domain-containing protein